MNVVLDASYRIGLGTLDDRMLNLVNIDKLMIQRRNRID